MGSTGIGIAAMRPFFCLPGNSEHLYPMGDKIGYVSIRTVPRFPRPLDVRAKVKEVMFLGIERVANRRETIENFLPGTIR